MKYMSHKEIALNWFRYEIYMWNEFTSCYSHNFEYEIRKINKMMVITNLIGWEIVLNTVVKSKVNHIKHTIPTDSCCKSLIQTLQPEAIFFYDFTCHIKCARCLFWPEIFLLFTILVRMFSSNFKRKMFTLHDLIADSPSPLQMDWQWWLQLLRHLQSMKA